MTKARARHLLAVLLAAGISYGLYLTINSPTDLSADILGIQRGDVVSSDLRITQSDDQVHVVTNRDLPALRSMSFVVLFDGHQIEATMLEAVSPYGVSYAFEADQGSIIVTFDDQSLQEGEQIMTIQGFDSTEDLLIAEMIATFTDGDTQRLTFSQPY